MAKSLKKGRESKPISSSKETSPVKIWQRKYFFETAIFIFAFCLFANSIVNSYNLDDELVTINHRLTSKGISAIPEIFTSYYYQDESGYKYEYRPIVLTSFAIEHSLLGDNPHASHFFNVLLYALLCTLLYIVLKRLFKDYSPLFIFLIVFIYAAHPAHTEVVDSIKNRDELFALGFALLSLYYCLIWIDSDRRWTFAVPLFIVLALLSKFSIIPTCLVIPLLILFFRPVSRRRYMSIAAIYVLIIMLLAPLPSLKFQFIFLLSSVLLYIVAYLLFHFDWKDSGRFISSARQIIKVNEETRADIPLSKVTLGLSVVGASLLSVATWYMYFNHSIWLTVACLAFNTLIYFRAPSRYQKVLMPFILFTVLILCYFMQDHDGLVGYCIMSILALTIYKNNTPPYKYFLIALILVSLFILWPWGNIKFIFPLLLIPNRWQKWTLFAMIPVSILLLVVPLYNILILDKWIEDLTAGLLLFWALILLIQRGVPTYKLSHGVLLILPLMVAISDYDSQHKTFFVLKHYNSEEYSWRPMLVQKDKLKNGLQTTQNQIKDVVQNSNKLFLVNTSKPDSSILSEKERASISIVQGFLSQSNRPVLFIEQPVSMTDTGEVKIASGADMMRRCLQLSIFPYPLSFYYGYSEIKALHYSDNSAIFAILLCCGLLLISIYFFLRKDLVGYALLLFFFLSAPICTFITPVPGAFADRFLLFPSLFMVIIIVRLIFWNQQEYIAGSSYSWNTLVPFKKTLLISICLLFSLLTILRTNQWKNCLTLYKHDINYVPNSAEAHNLLALCLIKNSFDSASPAIQTEMRKEGAEHFRKSVEIYPYFFNTNYDLARCYALLNENDSAIVWFKKSLVINPEFLSSALSIGELYFVQNKDAEAIPYFDQVNSKSPYEYPSYDRLGRIYMRHMQFDSAISVYGRAIRYIPKVPDSYLNAGLAYERMNKPDSARIYFEKTLQIDPGNQNAIQMLKKMELKH